MDKDSRYMVIRFEKIWRKEFQEQENPFIAYKWWTSEEQRQRRRTVYAFYEGISNGKELL
jgi:hypothetical protein